MCHVMAYTFTTTQEGDMLVVRVGGTRPALDADVIEQMWGFWSPLADRCRRDGIRRILSINSPLGQAKSTSMVALFKRFAEIGLTPSLRMAMVVADAHGRRVIELGAALAVEKGWSVKIFAAEDEARQWLMLD
jgi:hypothetical protein